MAIFDHPSIAPKARDVQVADGQLTVNLRDGRTIAVPLAWFPRLANATPDQWKHYRLIGEGYGISWPDLDEDIRVGRLLEPWPEHENGGLNAPDSSAS